MQLELTDDALIIQLSRWEQVWSVRFQSTITIPLAHIESIDTDLPPTDWRELRAPGSFVPGLIKAGTYYTPRGKEFWYATRPKKSQETADRKTPDWLGLRLVLRDEDYRAIVLTLPNPEAWQTAIAQRL